MSRRVELQVGAVEVIVSDADSHESVAPIYTQCESDDVLTRREVC